MRIQQYNLDCGQVELGADATLTGSRWTSNNYITRCHGQVQLVWSQLLQFEAVRTSFQQRAGTQWLSSPAERGRSAAKDGGTGGQYVAVFVQSPTHLSHINLSQLFSNKVWEVYFSKEACSFVIIVDFASACICIRIVGCDYATLLRNSWTLISN